MSALVNRLLHHAAPPHNRRLDACTGLPRIKTGPPPGPPPLPAANRLPLQLPHYHLLAQKAAAAAGGKGGLLMVATVGANSLESHIQDT